MLERITLEVVTPAVGFPSVRKMMRGILPHTGPPPKLLVAMLQH